MDIRVEWGHCDPARIIYNPNYFTWMEDGAHFLFEAAGLNLNAMAMRDHDFRGIPLIKSEVVFKAPARVGDLLVLSSRVARWGGKSFDIEHRFFLDGAIITEGRQTRVWGHAVAHDPDRLEAIVVPDSVRTALSVDKVIHLRLTPQQTAD